MKKATFGIIVFLVAFAVPVTVYTLISSSGDFDTAEEAAESVGSEEAGSRPRIVSVPSTEVVVGESYSYRVRASDDDSDALSLEFRVTHMPSWLKWDGQLTSFDGAPTSDDIGSHRVEVTVSDGTWVDTQTFEIDVLSAGGDAGGGSGTVVDQRDDPVIAENPHIVPADATRADSGLVPVSSSSIQTEPEVLGEATLPQTSIFTGVLGLSVGVGIVALALFLWIDTRAGISERTVSWVQYQRGRQIKMDVGDGVKVKKRKIRV